jgi:Ribosomal protein S3, N-terminal domain.
MGQSSIPLLNRSGYSMFWSSLWDSKYTYSKLVKEDYFIRQYINNIFKEKISSKPVFFLKNFKNFSHFTFSKFNINIAADLSVSSLSKFLFKANKLPSYLSKIRIIRFQKWLIIYFRIYTPNSLKIISFRKRNFSFYKFYYTYYSHFLKKRISKFEF